MFHKYHLLNQLQVFMRYKKLPKWALISFNTNVVPLATSLRKNWTSLTMWLFVKSFLKVQNTMSYSSSIGYNFKLHMDDVEDYVRKWTQRDKWEGDTLSDWVEAVRSLIQIRISKAKRSMSTRATSILKDPHVAKPCQLFTTHMLLFLQIRFLAISFSPKIKSGPWPSP